MSFRDLRRYESQKSAYDNYKAWQALSPDAKQAAFAAITDETKRVKPVRTNGYISPFNQSGALLKYLVMPTLKKGQDSQGSTIGTTLTTILDPFYIDSDETPPAGGGITYPRFKAARLSLTVRSAFAKKFSRITKRGYSKPDVDTYSAPFGQSVAGQTYQEALLLQDDALVAWKDAAAAGTKRAFRYTPEG